MPKRVQITRRKNGGLPPGAVYVGRPTKWGNPFRVHPIGDGRYSVEDDRGTGIIANDPESARRSAVNLFRAYLNNEGTEPGQIRDSGGAFLKQIAPAELRGLDLACWCPIGFPCHADVLLEIANA